MRGRVLIRRLKPARRGAIAGAVVLVAAQQLTGTVPMWALGLALLVTALVDAAVPGEPVRKRPSAYEIEGGEDD